MEKVVDELGRRRIDARRLFEIGEAGARHALGGAESVEQRAFARRADAGDFVERAFDEFLLALGAMRADGEAMRLVAQALHEIERGIARRQPERIAALDEERLAAGVAVGAFGDRGEAHALDAQFGENLPRLLELSAPAVDQHEIGPFGKGARRLRRRLAIALPGEARETPPQHFAHHRVIVARRQRRALDVERAVLVLHEAVGAGDDHRADRIGPHDVGIVEDFDAADRMIDAEGGAERGEQFLLRRRVGELARQSFARIAHRVLDELALFAAFRRADRDAVAGARAQAPRRARRGFRYYARAEPGAAPGRSR